MRKLILRAAVVAVALLTCTVVTAQTTQWMTDPNASGDVAVRDIVHPLVPQYLTQSNDPDTIESGSGVACSDGVFTTENSWLRLFDLDFDHGLVNTWTTESVDWGMETLTGDVDIHVNIYCLDDGLPFLYQFMTVVDTATTTATTGDLVFYNTPLHSYGACEPLSQSLVVELFGEDCEIVGTCTLYWIGANDLGQTAPSYIASASCGIVDPTDLAAIGFPDSHLVMEVNGDSGSDGGPDDGGFPDDGGGDAPATTGVGAVLLLLILLGSGAYLTRNRRG
jgi:hypothetical protein